MRRQWATQSYPLLTTSQWRSNRERLSEQCEIQTEDEKDDTLLVCHQSRQADSSIASTSEVHVSSLSRNITKKIEDTFPGHVTNVQLT